MRIRRSNEGKQKDWKKRIIRCFKYMLGAVAVFSFLLKTMKLKVNN